MKKFLVAVLALGALTANATEIAFNCRINAEFKSESVSVPAMTGIDYILGTQFTNDTLEGCLHTAKIWQSDIIKHEQSSKVESVVIRYLQDDVDFTGKVQIK